MPNWCDNIIHVMGAVEDVKAFRTAAQGKDNFGEHLDFDFHRFAPLDLSSVERKDSFAAMTIVAKQWGTKWNLTSSTKSLEEDFTEHGTGLLVYTFPTAWSPPLPVVAAASKAFPELIFYHAYYELGEGFAGVQEHVKGETIRNEYTEEPRDFLTEELGFIWEDEEEWV